MTHLLGAHRARKARQRPRANVPLGCGRLRRLRQPAALAASRSDGLHMRLCMLCCNWSVAREASMTCRCGGIGLEARTNARLCRGLGGARSSLLPRTGRAAWRAGCAPERPTPDCAAAPLHHNARRRRRLSLHLTIPLGPHPCAHESPRAHCDACWELVRGRCPASGTAARGLARSRRCLANPAARSQRSGHELAGIVKQQRRGSTASARRWRQGCDCSVSTP
jgi:hypothetical protein